MLFWLYICSCLLLPITSGLISKDKFYGSELIRKSALAAAQYEQVFTVPEEGPTTLRLTGNGTYASKLLWEEIAKNKTGWRALILELTPTEKADTNDVLDLTPIQFLHNLSRLWVIGDTAQFLLITFKKHAEKNNLKLEEVHFVGLTINEGFPSFEGMFKMSKSLIVLNFNDCVLDQGILFLQSLFSSISSEKLQAISLQSVQTVGQENYSEIWNLTTIFQNYRKFDHVDYLDFSFNDLTYLTQGFLRFFPNLKYFDFSHNNPVSGTTKFASAAQKYPYLLELVILHPTLEVLDVSSSTPRMCLKETYAVNIGGTFGIMGSVKCPINVNYLFSKNLSRAESCKFIKCFSQLDYLPCEYVPEFIDIRNASCYSGYVVPISKHIQEIYWENVVSKQKHFYNIKRHDKPACMSWNNLRVLSFAYSKSYDTTNLNYQIVGFEHLEKLDLRGIQWIVSSFLEYFLPSFPNLKSLQLSESNAYISNNLQLCNFSNKLEILNISSMDMDKFPEHLLRGCENIKMLSIANNKLNFLPKQIQTDLDRISDDHTVELDMSENELRCHCEHHFIDFIKWMQTTKVRVMNFEQYQCFNGSHFVSVKEFTHLCFIEPPNIPLIVTGTIAITSLSTLLLVSSFYSIHKYKYRLKTLFYRLLRHFRRNRAGHVFTYDVYLSYCDEDFALVVYFLLPILESKFGFTCCVRDRNFPLGVALRDMTSHCIRKSQVFLSIISKNSINKKQIWPKFERRFARHLEITENMGVIYIESLESRESLGADVPRDIKEILNANQTIKLPMRGDSEPILCRKRNDFVYKLGLAVYKSIS